MRQFLFKVMIFVFSMQSLLYAELLVVKKDAGGLFAPLSKEESLRHGAIISNILLTYQWPMCITSELSKQDQDELLAAGRPGAEEIFIQSRLQAAIPELNLQVVFIPTALYELFCIIQFFTELKPLDLNSKHDDANWFDQTNSYNKAVVAMIYNRTEFLKRQWDIDVLSILNESATTGAEKVKIHEDFFNEYKKVNVLFFGNTTKAMVLSPSNNQDSKKSVNIFTGLDETASLYINNSLLLALFKQYPELMHCKNVTDISIWLQNHMVEIIPWVLKKLKVLYDSNKIISSITYKYNPGFVDDFADAIKALIKNLIDSMSTKNQILKNVIALEYEARELNKALLLRGTSLIRVPIGLQKEEEKKPIIGTSLHGKGGSVSELADLYRKKKLYNDSYSISFGNSLFAGFMFDETACAYYYLMRQNAVVGYGLLVNKKDQIEHENFRLFFIPPLASIAALNSRGEFFHARSKAAMNSQFRDASWSVSGFVHGFRVKDPASIVLITRDPLLHAQLFAQYLADNGRLIQEGDMSNLTEDEKKFVTELEQSQKKLPGFYQSVQTLAPRLNKEMVQKVTQGYKTKNERIRREKKELARLAKEKEEIARKIKQDQEAKQASLLKREQDVLMIKIAQEQAEQKALSQQQKELAKLIQKQLLSKAHDVKILSRVLDVISNIRPIIVEQQKEQISRVLDVVRVVKMYKDSRIRS